MTAPVRSRFNPGIHGARGLFSVMVFVYHVAHSGLAGFLSDRNPINLYLLLSFKFGVELFFGISGFVILGALARAPSLRAFLWDRATRIYPLLWTTLVAIIVASLVVGHWRPRFGSVLLNFLALPPFIPLPQVNPAAWSLGYELTFYALCALCWVIRRRGDRLWLVVAVVAGALLLSLFPRAILMPAGLVIAAGMARHSLFRRLSAAPGIVLLAFLLCWRGLDLAQGGDIMTYNPVDTPFGIWLARLPLILGTGALGGLALLGIAERRGLLGRWLCGSLFQWLGTISYSFYLWHPVVMSSVKQVMVATGVATAAGPAAQLLFAVLAFPPALIVAHYSQIWIEVALTRRLRRLGPREDAGQAPITALAHPAALVER